jgi:hypothetical protein
MARMLDPQGRNPKDRPVVIVTAGDEIRAGEPIVVVAISGQLDEVPPEDQVELPWHPRGHPKTGLRKRCTAVCTWLAEIRHEDILEHKGNVPGKYLIEILKKLSISE